MTTLFLSMILLASGPTRACPATAVTNPPVAAAELKEVRRLLNGVEFEQRVEVIEMAEKLYPAFQIILADPKSKPQHLIRAMYVITKGSGDRSQFVGTCLAWVPDCMYTTAGL